MYCTSSQLKRLGEDELSALRRQYGLKLPDPYCDFMKTYGDGTCGGVIFVQPPDLDILKNISEYDFWQIEDAPITREQIGECAVIGGSIDGDYIAVHPEVHGYLLFPRHSDRLIYFPFQHESFAQTVGRIAEFLYRESLAGYFEPAGASYLFLRCEEKNLLDIAGHFKSRFGSDYLVENRYTCEVFLERLGGSVRFNLSSGFEVVVSYRSYGAECLEEIKAFLAENGGR